MILGLNIRLRALEPEDLEKLYDWENNLEWMRFGDVHLPYGKHLIRDYLERAHEDFYHVRQLRFMIDALLPQPGAVGHIDLYDFEPHHMRAAVGLLIANREDRGKGYASEALDCLIQYAREYLHLHQLHCTVQPWNEISLGLFESRGFSRVGILKSWARTPEGYEDLYFLQKLL